MKYNRSELNISFYIVFCNYKNRHYKLIMPKCTFVIDILPIKTAIIDLSLNLSFLVKLKNVCEECEVFVYLSMFVCVCIFVWDYYVFLLLIDIFFEVFIILFLQELIIHVLITLFCIFNFVILLLCFVFANKLLMSCTKLEKNIF